MKIQWWTSSVAYFPRANSSEIQRSAQLARPISASAAVAANRPDPDKYDFSMLSLLVTAGLIIAYMAFVYAMSFKQYKEVVAEKFGSLEGGTP